MSADEGCQARKAEARHRLREEARRHGEVERRTASEQLCGRLQARAEWIAARYVLGFFPLPSEPDIRPVLEAALRDGKRLALPRFRSGSGDYEPVEIRDLAQDLVPGAFGIREPADTCRVSSMNPLDLILVPGIGFDLAFGRLGRGKGHYDRLLAGTDAWVVGVGFDWQVEVAVPTEPHDIPLDFLVTPSRWLERLQVC
ncbi:MAG: 5-formyltetrahydrofolate cyclo-ligase [Verrucomicrobia bacterium]|nr:5-formyltetrahydrofolate cyclo-ligase [Verrucomicrobiota bacterium]